MTVTKLVGHLLQHLSSLRCTRRKLRAITGLPFLFSLLFTRASDVWAACSLPRAICFFPSRSKSPFSPSLNALPFPRIYPICPLPPYSDRDACAPTNPCDSERSVCLDVPAAEHVGITDAPEHLCACRSAAGYSGEPGADGSGCARSTLVADDAGVRFTVGDSRDVIFRFGGGASATSYALGDMRATFDALTGPGGSITAVDERVDATSDGTVASHTAAVATLTAKTAAATTAAEVDRKTLASMLQTVDDSLDDTESLFATTDAARTALSAATVTLTSEVTSLRTEHGGLSDEHTELSDTAIGNLLAGLNEERTRATTAVNSLETKQAQARSAVAAAELAASNALADLKSNSAADAARRSNQLLCLQLPGMVWNAGSGACNLPTTVTGFLLDKFFNFVGRASKTNLEVDGWRSEGAPGLFSIGFTTVNAASGRPTAFRVGQTGIYTCHAMLQWRNHPGSSSGDYVRVYIARQRAPSSKGAHHITNEVGSAQTLNVNQLLALRAGELVSVYAVSNSRTNWEINTESSLSCAFLGPLDLGGVDAFSDTMASTFGPLGHSVYSINRFVTNGPNTVWSRSGTNTAKGYTAPADGLYIVNANQRFDATAGRMALQARINGNYDERSSLYATSDSLAANYESISIAGVVFLREGDLLQLFVKSYGDTQWYAQQESGFSAGRLPDTYLGRPGFFAHKKGSQTYSSSIARITGWDTEPALDTGRFNSGHFTVSNGIFTAPVDGVYFTTASMVASNTGGTMRLFIAINSVPNTANGLTSYKTAGAPYLHTIAVTASVFLVAGQKLTMELVGGSGTHTLTDRANFGAVLVGPTNTAQWMAYLEERNLVNVGRNHNIYESFYNNY